MFSMFCFKFSKKLDPNHQIKKSLKLIKYRLLTPKLTIPLIYNLEILINNQQLITKVLVIKLKHDFHKKFSIMNFDFEI
jgi:hypothetical protein